MTISQFAKKYYLDIIDVLFGYLNCYGKGAHSSQFLTDHELEALKKYFKL